MDWQLPIVIVAVGCAGSYLLRTYWQAWTGTESNCGGGCSRCPSKSPQTQLVALDLDLNNDLNNHQSGK